MLCDEGAVYYPDELGQVLDQAVQSLPPNFRTPYNRTAIEKNILVCGNVMDARAARVHAHRSNIRRYRKLLETPLTDVERDYIEGRLSEERAILQGLQPDEAHRL